MSTSNEHHGDWDSRYSDQEQIWSGAPNHALTVEVAPLAPGRALDVGCGEGADAVWLAGRGWQVTALDPSAVALGRARAVAQTAGVEVSWVHGVLADADLPEGGFDLVSVFYPALERDASPVERLASLVAPGGTLLVVHHADVDRDRALEHGFDPDTLMSSDDVAAGLGDAWAVSGPERRARDITGGQGAHHHDDLVVRAVRSPGPRGR
jgi:SAM-dependent methyltransferase